MNSNNKKTLSPIHILCGILIILLIKTLTYKCENDEYSNFDKLLITIIFINICYSVGINHIHLTHHSHK